MILRLAGAILLSLCLVQTAQAHSLRDALSAAYRNSDLLDQNRFLLRLSDENVAQQIAGLRPIISFTASTTYTTPTDLYTTSLNLVADLLVYDNGGSQLLIASAREQVESAREGLVSLEQQVLLDAVTAYINVWQDIQVVQVREANVRVVTEQLRAAQDRFEVGEDTRTDVAQAEASLASAQSDLAAARGQLEISEELYILAVGIAPIGIAGPGALPSFPASEAEADSIARANHPLIRQLQRTVAADELSLAAARTDYGPTVTLRATTGRNSSAVTGNRSNSTALTLTFDQPIYSGGQLFSLERVALATLAATRSELNQQVRVIIQNVGEAYAVLRIANAQIIASDQEIRAAELAFQGVQEEAALGARTTLDVLDAEQDVIDARIGRIEAQADLYIGAYAVLSSIGLLTVSNLGLPVDEYDPEAYAEAFSNAPARITSEQGERLDAILSRIGRD
ncbi:MAG: TolC family outer membrane protein [Pseudomonadota bacterium]